MSRALVNLSFRDEPGVFIQQYSELVAAIERAVKRALDVVISMTGDPVFAAIAIKLDSGGPVIFPVRSLSECRNLWGSRSGLSRPARLP